MDDAVRAYVDAIDPEHRPLFDRVHRLVIQAHPDALVVISYQMPSYRVGKQRLFVAAWRHGISLYGWKRGDDGGFTARHPDLQTSTGTVRLRPQDAAALPDEELLGLVDAALGSR